MPEIPTPTFGLIAEGETDQNVIDSILAGIFDDPDFEARRLRPLTSAPADAPERFGGWPNVLQYIASPEFEEAFQLVNFVVVHIDTDDCEKYDVRKQEAGETLNATDLVDRVVDNLKTRIGPDVWERVGARVVFAVVVDSIECWLLLLYMKAGDKPREQNCLDHLNRTLAKRSGRDKVFIAASNKSPQVYTRLGKDFDDPKKLKVCAEKSASLKRFVDNVHQAIQTISSSGEICAS